MNLVWRLGAGLMLLVGVACQPKIGDDCDINANCSDVGDRMCDRSQPGGYCTQFNCEPGTCPDEATCIGFRTVVSSLATEEGDQWVCADPQDTSRFQRTFCMRSCRSNSDCRAAYDCIDMAKPGNPFGAVLVESHGSGKVCAVRRDSAPITYSGGDGIPGVCTGDPGISAGGVGADPAGDSVAGDSGAGGSDR